MIQKFKSEKQKELIDFVLEIQNGEFNLGFERFDQKDIIDTAKFYNGGGFWVEEIENEIVGCIGLQKLDFETGILRKMFVKKELRGKSLNIAQNLFDTLKQEAIKLNLKRILLDTPSVAVASHRFYLKNGFQEITRQNIPNEYSYPDRNSKIFELILT